MLPASPNVGDESPNNGPGCRGAILVFGLLLYLGPHTRNRSDATEDCLGHATTSHIPFDSIRQAHSQNKANLRCDKCNTIS
jgi:hypothetical protein